MKPGIGESLQYSMGNASMSYFGPARTRWGGREQCTVRGVRVLYNGLGRDSRSGATSKEEDARSRGKRRILVRQSALAKRPCRAAAYLNPAVQGTLRDKAAQQPVTSTFAPSAGIAGTPFEHTKNVDAPSNCTYTLARGNRL